MLEQATGIGIHFERSELVTHVILQYANACQGFFKVSIVLNHGKLTAMIVFKSMILVSILSATLGLALPAKAESGDASADAAIYQLVGRFEQAVNSKDVKAFGSIFAEDGEFTNPVGMSVKGRTAI